MPTRLAEVATLTSQDAFEVLLRDSIPNKTFVVTPKEVEPDHVPRFYIDFVHTEWDDMPVPAAGRAWTEISRAFAAARRERADMQFDAKVWPGG